MSFPPEPQTSSAEDRGRRLAGVLLLCPKRRVLYADPQGRAALAVAHGAEGSPLADAVPAEVARALAPVVEDGGGVVHLSLPGGGGAAALAVSRLPDGPRGSEGFVIRVLQDAVRPAVAATRGALVNRLERALARARRRTDYTFALLWIDYPHVQTGDAESDDLRVVEVLQDAVRPMDLAARLGPGSFGVLLHGLHDEVDAFHIARRLHASLRLQDRGPVLREPATGVVLSADTTDAEAMLRQAEGGAALARTERSRVAAFEPRRHLRAARQLRVEQELPLAIAGGELRLLYQPIVAVATRAVVGFEALVRWQHPHDGLLLPDRFVPAAERAGLIAELDLWSVATACAQTRRWLDAGVLAGDGFVSVNLSARTLDRDDTAERVLRSLEEAGLEPERLLLEITETALVERTEVANATLLHLRAAGARVAIDDFGSGYCSLAYLLRLPVDVLKVDRSLLRGRSAGDGAARLLEGVIALARCMALPVTIEGVETGADLALLADVGEGHAQGFAFAPPLDADAAATFAAPPAVAR